MEATELLKKVRKIEIKTRRLSQDLFSGEYHSAFKGRGMSFSEVREYTPGDDIRSIDWNVTARFNHPFVKIFEEERELTVMLLVDLSASENFGTKKQLKQEMITELCAVIAFSAIQNNDKIGMIFFTDRVEKFIPPKKGKSHILHIIRELLEFKPQGKKTDIAGALRYFTNAIKKKSIAFVISDFLDSNFSDALRIASGKHDLVALRIYDKHEKELPAMGLVQFYDAETGKVAWLNTSNASVRNRFYAAVRKKEQELKEIFMKSRVDVSEIATDQSYIEPLTTLFAKRGRG